VIYFNLLWRVRFFAGGPKTPQAHASSGPSASGCTRRPTPPVGTTRWLPKASRRSRRMIRQSDLAHSLPLTTYRRGAPFLPQNQLPASNLASNSRPDPTQNTTKPTPKALVALERVAHSRYAKNSGDLASSRRPPLLEVALSSPPRWGQKTCERGSSDATRLKVRRFR
jgi:hypothetical protein